MNIKISTTAKQYLKKKEGFFLSRNRKARLILVAKTCHGAEFRIVYEAPLPDDELFVAEGCELFIAPELISEYGGFTFDTELFFFARRLLISPVEQKYGCDCTAKCSNKQSACPNPIINAKIEGEK